MSRTASASTEQHSPLEHEIPRRPPLADHTLRETAVASAAASVAPPAAILAASAPAAAAVIVAVVVAALVARRMAGRRRDAARVERDAARSRSTESSGTGTVSAAD